jgi:probable rRNA maturation factor
VSEGTPTVIPAPPEVLISGASRFPEVRPRVLRWWLAEMLTEIAPEAQSFSVRFVGDRTMRALNREFRGRDETTDVLSFPGGMTPEGNHLGDVVVSVPRAKSQAAEKGHPPEHEIRVLLLHGVLHCLGHDHETDAGQMARLERKLQARWLGRR